VCQPGSTKLINESDHVAQPLAQKHSQEDTNDKTQTSNNFTFSRANESADCEGIKNTIIVYCLRFYAL
jgi:hypothetical protein